MGWQPSPIPCAWASPWAVATLERAGVATTAVTGDHPERLPPGASGGEPLDHLTGPRCPPASPVTPWWPGLPPRGQAADRPAAAGPDRGRGRHKGWHQRRPALAADTGIAMGTTGCSPSGSPQPASLGAKRRDHPRAQPGPRLDRSRQRRPLSQHIPGALATPGQGAGNIGNAELTRATSAPNWLICVSPRPQSAQFRPRGIGDPRFLDAFAYAGRGAGLYGSREPVWGATVFRLPQTVPDRLGVLAQVGGSPFDGAGLGSTDLMRMACKRPGLRVDQQHNFEH